MQLQSQFFSIFLCGIIFFTASVHAQDFPLEPNPQPVIPSPSTDQPIERVPQKKVEMNVPKIKKPQTSKQLKSINPSIVVSRQLKAKNVSDTDKDATDTENTNAENSDEENIFSLLETPIERNSRQELRWTLGQSFDGSEISTPVTVIHGKKEGPILCLTAAVHGDELNGVEVVRRIANELNPKELSGTFIGVPIVNLFGFSRGTRYLPDRRDLNRFFPGTNSGSAASRIAKSFFDEIIVHCDALVDFHTGSFERSNLPQVRGDLRISKVLAFTRGFGATPVLHSPGSDGMLRLATTKYGIPAVTFEVGAPLRLEPQKIDFAVEAIQSLMHKMGMIRNFRLWSEPQAIFYGSKWIRTDQGGMLFNTVSLGDRIRAGQRLGKVIDPVRNAEYEILSPFPGRVIGMALNQLVLPGFAAYHIGIETTEQQAAAEAVHQLQSTDAIELQESDEQMETEEDEN